MKTTITPKSMRSSEEVAKQINSPELMREFKNILSILNKYYSVMSGSFSKAQAFRQRVASEENVIVSVKKCSNHEYLVTAEIGEEKDFWTHIDGIAEERDYHRKQGNLNHPVFSIICLSDIYDQL